MTVVVMRVTISGIRFLLINSLQRLVEGFYFGCWEKSESFQMVFMWITSVSKCLVNPQPQLGDLLPIVANHLLNGTILQVQDYETP